MRQPWGDLLAYRRPSSNQHLLAALLIKLARQLPARGELLYRAPSLAAHLVYLAFCLAWCRRLGGGAVAALAFALLGLNPFLLDFFSLARGYGLALAGQLASLYGLARLLERPTPGAVALACAPAALAATAHFAWLDHYLALLALLACLALEARLAGRGERAVAPAFGPAGALAALVPTAALALVAALPLARLARAGELYYGGGDALFRDAVGSLVRASLYGALPAAQGPLALGVALALAGGFAASLWHWRGSGRRLGGSAPAAFGVLLGLLAAAAVLRHRLFGMPLPMDRTALAFVPVFAVWLALAARALQRRPGARGPVAWAAGALAAALAAHGAARANFTHTLIWRPDADVKAAVAWLEQEAARRPPGAGGVRLAASWPLRPALRFYRRERELAWLRVEAVAGAPDLATCDLYLRLEGDYAFGYRAGPGWREAHPERLLRDFPVSRTSLYRCGPGPYPPPWNETRGAPMDLSYTPEEEAFRARTRAWIEAHRPPAGRRDPELLREWQRRLHRAGYLGAAWPREWGGAGLAPMQQAILNEELARANAPAPLGHMGLTWVGPAILSYGSEAQKRRFIEPLLRGDDVWATGYSEPGAGSDMFNTQTRAEREGDGWVVNGQKIWTSQATECNWYFLLVRTSSEGQKWAGLSVLLAPLATPGIEIRPIRQLNGESHFCEVFLRDVRVPQDALLGREGQGYEIVSSALINERTGISGSIRFDHAFGKIVETARQRGLAGDPVWRQRIADLAIKARIMKAMSLRVLSDQLHDRFNPHTSAAMKCIASHFTQDFSEAGVEMLGPFGVLLERDPDAPGYSVWPERFLGDRAMTIAGGTSEIQRNIVAERILGLPRR